ncbi:hypothetical protein AB4Y45_35670 [Paraburkholderia sp. EG287A]|uniref:hypothetical protein n=1 Tax=Paraburkholderia sp. EG287A TaxID=3237012 RepID=UPI0034D28210
MLTLALQLVDRVIQLEKRREDVRRNRYADFVAPMMGNVDAIHKDYLDSFRKYEAMLDDSSVPLTQGHPIFSAIKSDNLYSEGLRAKVDRLEPLNFYDIDTDLARFVDTVRRYLVDTMYDEREQSSQYIRTPFALELMHQLEESSAPDKLRRATARLMLTQTVERLQQRYGELISLHENLKKTLLKPH